MIEKELIIKLYRYMEGWRVLGKDLAKKLEISPQTLSKIMCREKDLPKAEIKIRIYIENTVIPNLNYQDEHVHSSEESLKREDQFRWQYWEKKWKN